MQNSLGSDSAPALEWKKLGLPLAGVLFVAILLWLLWLWQPERQILMHNSSLVRAFEKRNWEKAEALIDPQYADRWGYNRERLLRDAREVFRQFFILEIRQESLLATTEEGAGTVSARIRVKGNGGPLAELVVQRVNQLNTSFQFKWVRQSWKPWDWRLIQVENAGLELPASGDGFSTFF